MKATKGEADRLVGFAFFLVCSSAQLADLLCCKSALWQEVYLLCVDIEKIHGAELINAGKLRDEKRRVALVRRNTDANTMGVDRDVVVAPERVVGRGQILPDTLLRTREEKNAPDQIGEGKKKYEIIHRSQPQCAADGIEYGNAEHEEHDLQRAAVTQKKTVIGRLAKVGNGDGIVYMDRLHNEHLSEA